MIFPIQLLIYCNDNNIFWGGGRAGQAGHFGLEASTHKYLWIEPCLGQTDSFKVRSLRQK